MSREGIKPVAPVPARWKSRPALGLAVLVALTLAVRYLILRSESPTEKKGIVVLPFENLGPEEQEYFAAGITEEVTSRLAAVHDLRVIAYLRGLEHLTHPDFPAPQQTAVQMFERAVKLDPQFALAYAKLSEAQAILYYGNVGPLQERLLQAKEAADRALELAPDLPQAHIAMGSYHYRAAREYDLALEGFRTAQLGLPNDPEVYANIGAILRRQGKFEETVRYYKKELELKPLSAIGAAELAETLGCLRRYDEAANYADRSIALLPDQTYAYLLKANILWMWEGATEKSRATIEAIPDQNDAHAIAWWYRQELYERNYQAALERISYAPEQIENWPKSLFEGFVYRLLNEQGRARACAEASRVQLEKMVKENPEWPGYHSVLGIAYAALGRREEAVREGQRAVDLLPISTDALEGPYYVALLSYIYALVGDHEAALDRIEHLLSIPAGNDISVQFLRVDPRWDELRHLPRFQKLLGEHK